jgi:hypothetical protein
MKKILFTALLFLFAGCTSYWHDNSRDDRRSPHHEESRDGGVREHPGTR